MRIIRIQADPFAEPTRELETSSYTVSWGFLAPSTLRAHRDQTITQAGQSVFQTRMVTTSPKKSHV